MQLVTPVCDDHMDDLYPQLLRQVLYRGESVSPRGQNTLEIRPFVFQLSNPDNKLVTIPGRKINKAFALVEAFQFLSGKPNATQIVRFNSNLNNWVDPETGEIEAPYGLLVKDQVPRVIEMLKEDPDSRQAVLTIYNGHEHQKSMLNVPCTCLLQFFVRDGKLELIVYMRSNDLWWGTPYDVYQFTAMQELIGAALEMDLGTYTHIAGSGHIYEPFYAKAKDIVTGYRPSFVIGSSPSESQPSLFGGLSYEQIKQGIDDVLRTEIAHNGTEEEWDRYYHKVEDDPDLHAIMKQHLNLLDGNQARKRARG